VSLILPWPLRPIYPCEKCRRDTQTYEHGRMPLGQVGFHLSQDLFGLGSRRVMPEIFDGLVVLGKGVTEGRRFFVKLLLIIGIGPVFLRRHPEENHGPHGAAQKGPGVPLHLHQIAGDFA
jgi:hypothetical protein